MIWQVSLKNYLKNKNSKVFIFLMSRNHNSKLQKYEFCTNFVLQYLHWPSLAQFSFIK